MAVNYVSAPQANIYFGGILIDECYDIQYSYREAKEPIYGYLSKHFDAIVPGTVIITGALTINYKHDQYLSKVLEKAESPVAGRNKNTRPNTLRKYQEEYKNILSQYADALKKQSELKKRLAEAKITMDAAVTSYNDEVGRNFDSYLEQMKAEANAIRYRQELGGDDGNGVTQEEATRLTILEDEMEKLSIQKMLWLNDSNNTQYVNECKEDVQIMENELRQLDISGLRNQVGYMKDNIDSLMVTSNDLKLLEDDETSQSLRSVRAEEFRKGFTLEFNYNGSPHKRILGCELIGHGHCISQSGMPVKEQYTFIGKRME